MKPIKYTTIKPDVRTQASSHVLIVGRPGFVANAKAESVHVRMIPRMMKSRVLLSVQTLRWNIKKWVKQPRTNAATRSCQRGKVRSIIMRLVSWAWANGTWLFLKWTSLHGSVRTSLSKRCHKYEENIECHTKDERGWYDSKADIDIGSWRRHQICPELVMDIIVDNHDRHSAEKDFGVNGIGTP
jgi:hypothetical protein